MSITKDFERRKFDSGMSMGSKYLVHDVEVLLAHARALEAMLKKHEWVTDEGWDWCPECLEDKIVLGHAPDCELAKLLEGTPNRATIPAVTFSTAKATKRFLRVWEGELCESDSDGGPWIPVPK